MREYSKNLSGHSIASESNARTCHYLSLGHEREKRTHDVDDLHDGRVDDDGDEEGARGRRAAGFCIDIQPKTSERESSHDAVRTHSTTDGVEHEFAVKDALFEVRGELLNRMKEDSPIRSPKAGKSPMSRRRVERGRAK